MLFIDARQIYHQIDRAHREFTPEQIEFLANIVRLYRGEKPETDAGSEHLLAGTLSRTGNTRMCRACARWRR